MQTKLYSPVAGQPGRLCHQIHCKSPIYRSGNCGNNLKAVILGYIICSAALSIINTFEGYLLFVVTVTLIPGEVISSVLRSSAINAALSGYTVHLAVAFM